MAITNPITPFVTSVIDAEAPRAANAGASIAGYLDDLYEKLICLDQKLMTQNGFEWNDTLTTGLTFAYYGGVVTYGDGTYTVVAAGTVTLTDDALNYVEFNPSTGTIVANVTDWTDGYVPLYEVTTVSGAISESNVDDVRPCFAVLKGQVVAAANLSNTVADALNYVAFTVGGEAGNTIDVDIQVKDIQGNNLAEKRVLEIWLSDTATGWETATAADTGLSVQTGTAFDVPTALKRLRCATDATGKATIRIQHTAAQNWYMGCSLQNKISWSTVIAFT